MGLPLGLVFNVFRRMCLTCFRGHIYRFLEIALFFAVFMFFLLPIVLKIAVCLYVWPFLSFCFSLSSLFFLSNDRIPLLACVFQIDVWMSAKGWSRLRHCNTLKNHPNSKPPGVYNWGGFSLCFCAFAYSPLCKHPKVNLE